MRVLVTWGSKRGGTEGIARMIGARLTRNGFQVVLEPAGAVSQLDEDQIDAVIVGGALYGGRWHRGARRFVARHIDHLRRMPVWFFSSGPLDESAEHGEIPPVRQVGVLMERVGALGHATFGGRLESTATGFPARAMAKTHAGDWRNAEAIHAWAEDLARRLPSARPRPAVSIPARSLTRLMTHAVVGWALCGLAMAALLRLPSTSLAVALHAVVAPILFGLVSWHYFRDRGAREPLATAAVFTATTAVLDLVVVFGLVMRRLELVGSVAGLWLPLVLIFCTTWAVGALASTLPWQRPSAGSRGHAGSHARP